MAVGGDITEIRVSHPTLGSRSFQVKSNEDSTLNLGGIISNDDENGVTSAGEMIDQLNNTRWSASLVCAWNMIGADDLEFAQQLAANPVLGDWTITHISGTVYGGSGKPVGALEGNTNAATFDMKIAGGGKLKKIA